MALDVSYGEQSTQKEKRTEDRPLGKLISKGKKKSCLPEKLKGNAEKTELQGGRDQSCQ